MDVTLPIRREDARRTFIRYRDAKGEASDRIIFPLTARGYLDDRNTVVIQKIDARCETARARRTFLVQRIEAIADFETGEILDLDEWVRTLPTEEGDIAHAIRMRDQMAAIDAERLRREKSRQRWKNSGCLLILLVIITVLIVVIRSAPATSESDADPAPTSSAPADGDSSEPSPAAPGADVSASPEPAASAEPTAMPSETAAVVQDSGAPVVRRPMTDAPPLAAGQCFDTEVKEVTTKVPAMEDGQPVSGPPSGVAISFADGHRMAHFAGHAEALPWHAGDPVQLCVVSLPSGCPADDLHGVVWRARNLRDGSSWQAGDGKRPCIAY